MPQNFTCKPGVLPGTQTESGLDNPEFEPGFNTNPTWPSSGNAAHPRVTPDHFSGKRPGRRTRVNKVTGAPCFPCHSLEQGGSMVVLIENTLPVIGPSEKWSPRRTHDHKCPLFSGAVAGLEDFKPKPGASLAYPRSITPGPGLLVHATGSVCMGSSASHIAAPTLHRHDPRRCNASTPALDRHSNHGAFFKKAQTSRTTTRSALEA